MLGVVSACGAPSTAAEEPEVEVERVPPSETASESPDDALQRLEREIAPSEESARGDERDPQTELWIVRLGELLPGELCKDGSFFRACFTIGHAECEAVAAKHYGPCVNRHRAELPPIRDSDSGRRGGEILGRCVGVAFQLDLDDQGKFTDTQKCNDPSAW